jgi:surfeit locus 1 family protein
MRRILLLPTLVVAAAVATMIALGVWQLQRLATKEALLARYERARTLSADVAWPRTPGEVEQALFRHARVRCDRVVEQRPAAGHNQAGTTGWAQIARCALDGGGEAEVALGWSTKPEVLAWSGGEVGGFVAPGRNGAARLIAAPAVVGEQLALPDPRDIPNNHLAYAVQWFLFAGVAALIYALALRKKLRS